MQGLIKIQTNENQEQLVSAREIHEKLGINQDFTNWFKYQSTKLNLADGYDYSLLNNISEQTGRGGHNKVDYLIPIDIAKHIAMISGGEKAHEIRSYFIKVERAWNSPEQVMNRALEYSRQALIKATLQIEHDKPKVLFADSVATSTNSILIGELAKVLNQNGVEIGQNRLFERLRDDGYLCKYGERRNQPTQKAMDLDLFEIKKRTINNPDGSIRTTTTTKVTGKGQIYFINRFLKERDS
jgi:anti-repressor protein